MKRKTLNNLLGVKFENQKIILFCCIEETRNSVFFLLSTKINDTFISGAKYYSFTLFCKFQADRRVTSGSLSNISYNFK